jgi:hypothetical protein
MQAAAERLVATAHHHHGHDNAHCDFPNMLQSPQPESC